MFSYLSSKLINAFAREVRVNQRVPWQFVPVLPDYTHELTDEDCCKLFNLNDEQTDFICNTLKTHSMKEFINYESEIDETK